MELDFSGGGGGRGGARMDFVAFFVIVVIVVHASYRASQHVLDGSSSPMGSSGRASLTATYRTTFDVTWAAKLWNDPAVIPVAAIDRRHRIGNLLPAQKRINSPVESMLLAIAIRNYYRMKQVVQAYDKLYLSLERSCDDAMQQQSGEVTILRKIYPNNDTTARS
jgi:hypothetical protein